MFKYSIVYPINFPVISLTTSADFPTLGAPTKVTLRTRFFFALNDPRYGFNVWVGPRFKKIFDLLADEKFETKLMFAIFVSKW